MYEVIALNSPVRSAGCLHIYSKFSLCMSDTQVLGTCKHAGVSVPWPCKTSPPALHQQACLVWPMPHHCELSVEHLLNRFCPQCIEQTSIFMDNVKACIHCIIFVWLRPCSPCAAVLPVHGSTMFAKNQRACKWHAVKMSDFLAQTVTP